MLIQNFLIISTLPSIVANTNDQISNYFTGGDKPFCFQANMKKNSIKNFVL